MSSPSYLGFVSAVVGGAGGCWYGGGWGAGAGAGKLATEERPLDDCPLEDAYPTSELELERG